MPFLLGSSLVGHYLDPCPKPLFGCVSIKHLEGKEVLFKGGYLRDSIGDYYRGLKWDIRSLDYSSYNTLSYLGLCKGV